MLKRIGLIFTLAALATSVASADILPFSWSTTGSFSTSPLSFTGVSAGSPVSTDASGNLTGISLGTIIFPALSTDFVGTFNLTVNFVRPDGSGNPVFAEPFTLTANVNGNSDNNDELTIDFPTASLLNFSGSDGTGSFTFGIPDVSFTRNGNNQTRTFALTGNIVGATVNAVTAQVAAVPEPSSVVLLFTALGGVAWKVRRRKRI
jgi:hypothetical protein